MAVNCDVTCLTAGQQVPGKVKIWPQATWFKTLCFLSYTGLAEAALTHDTSLPWAPSLLIGKWGSHLDNHEALSLSLSNRVHQCCHNKQSYQGISCRLGPPSPFSPWVTGAGCLYFCFWAADMKLMFTGFYRNVVSLWQDLSVLWGDSSLFSL